MSPTKGWRLFIVVLAVGALAVVATIVAPFAYDVYQDRNHSLTFTGQVFLFEKSESLGYARNDVVAILNKGDNVKVLRIWYGKDYQVVRVLLPDGRIGYLISGESGDYHLGN